MGQTKGKVAVQSWQKLGDIQLRKFLWWGRVDPTDELARRGQEFLMSERKKHNATIHNAFDLEQGSFTKYEFLWNGPAAAQQAAAVKEMAVASMELRTSIIYVKEKSFLLFVTNYEMGIGTGCMPNKGTVYVTGGRNYEMEEIFYKKVNSVQATHEEQEFLVYTSGCGGGTAPKVETLDGMRIRAYENFTVYHRDPNELHACRRDLNKRVQEVS